MEYFPEISSAHLESVQPLDCKLSALRLYFLAANVRDYQENEAGLDELIVMALTETN